MHSIKSRAKRDAWYSDPNEGGTGKYNPFGKRSWHTSRASTLRDEEQGTGSGRLNQVQTTPPGATGLGPKPAKPQHASTTPNPASNPDKGFKPSEDEAIQKVESPGEVEPIPEDPIKSSQEQSSDSAHVYKEESDKDALQQTTSGKKKKNKLLSLMSKEDGPVEYDDNGKAKHKFTVGNQLRATLFNSWINVLLICSPLGIALYYAKINDVAIFVVNFIALIPLAGMLSYATEEIALRTGEVIGGLLNASFGNAVELIVSIIALVKDQVLIVQTSLIGSILSNLLLVMGMCFFFGGINRVEQEFNMTVAQTAASLLFLAVSSLIIPTAFDEFARIGNAAQNASNPAQPKPHVAQLSRGVSVMLLLVYGCYLFFQLKSHVAMFSEPSKKNEKRNVGEKFRNAVIPGKYRGRFKSTAGQPEEAEEDGDEPEEPNLSLWVAIITLAASTVLVALNAEYLVDSINSITCGGSSISKNFVGLILIPIVGNAAEHATAVTVAVKDKMDLAIGVAVGSSMQIALLVLPLIVVLGWIIGKDDMTLFFDGFQITVVFVAVLLVNYLIQDGKSHWLEGVLLMVLYIIIAVAAYLYPANADGEQCG